MSVITTKTCDRCGATSSDKEQIWLDWVPNTLSVAVSVGRIATTVDLCPACQDAVFKEINDIRGSRGLVPIEAYRPYSGIL